MNFRSMISYSCISTNPEMLAEIGPVDIEIIGLTEIVKKKQKQNIRPPSTAASRRANNRNGIKHIVYVSKTCIQGMFIQCLI